MPTRDNKPTTEQALTRAVQEEPRPEPQYWVVFVLLAIFTALEVAAASFATLNFGIRIGVLVFLAVVKVALVVLYFMHLRFDSSIFALPFALGLVLMIPAILVITLSMNAVPFSSAAHAANSTGQLVDVREISYRIKVSQDTVPAGPVTFHVVNGADDMLHEFIIVKTDLEATDLPLDPVTSRVNEDAIEIVTSQDNIEPAHSRDINVNLDPGHYVLICNLPGHYLQGMMVDFHVNGTSPVPASTSEGPPSAPPTEQTPSGD
jgi:caa(3)-type oxidase subunit IV